MRAWADVAELTSTKTLNGGFVARSAPGLPFLLHEGVEVAFVPPVLDAPRRARVASVSQGASGEMVVAFEGIDSIEDAKPLVGCHCLVRRAEVPEAALAGVSISTWEGSAVYDAHAGLVGHVVGMREMPAQNLLEVRRADSYAIVLIPLVDAFIVSVDEKARRIDMDLPEGLLEL